MAVFPFVPGAEPAAENRASRRRRKKASKKGSTPSESLKINKDQVKQRERRVPRSFHGGSRFRGNR